MIYKKLSFIFLVFTLQLSGMHWLEPNFNNPKEGTWYYTNYALRASRVPGGTFMWNLYQDEYTGSTYMSTDPIGMAKLKQDLKDENLKYTPIVMDRVFHFIIDPASWFFQKLSEVHPVLSGFGDEAAVPFGTVTTMALIGFGVYKIYKKYKTQKVKSSDAECRIEGFDIIETISEIDGSVHEN